MASCAAAGARESTDWNTKNVAASATRRVTSGMWFSCLMSRQDEHGSGGAPPAIASGQQYLASGRPVTYAAVTTIKASSQPTVVSQPHVECYANGCNDPQNKEITVTHL